MEKIGSVLWLLSALAVGVLTTLIGTYLKPTLDKVLSKFSGRFSEHQLKLLKKRHDMIKRLKGNPYQQKMASLLQIRFQSSSIYLLTFSIWCFIPAIISTMLSTENLVLSAMRTILALIGIISTVASVVYTYVYHLNREIT